jgi:hypothetical protein
MQTAFARPGKIVTKTLPAAWAQPNFFSTTCGGGSTVKGMKKLVALQKIGRNSRWATPLRRALASLVLAGTVCFAPAALAVGDTPAATDYSRWIKPWSERTNSSSRLGTELKVVVTLVTGEQPLSVVTNLTPVQRLSLAYHLKTTGSEITTNGACWSYYATNLAANEAPVRWFSPGELKQLDELLARLPDDESSLPPPGKRLVVQVLEAGRWRIRVYDLTTAPAEVRDLLAFIGNPFVKTL